MNNNVEKTVSSRAEILRLLNKRPIAYYPIYREITGSTTAGILLSQLMYWFSKKDKFYKTDKEIMNETMLTKKELELAKKRIKKLNFIKVTREGIPSKTYYEIDWEKFEESLIDLELEKKYGDIPQKGETVNINEENVDASYPKRGKLYTTKGGNSTPQKGETITKNTSKSTSKNIYNDRESISVNKSKKDLASTSGSYLENKKDKEDISVNKSKDNNYKPKSNKEDISVNEIKDKSYLKALELKRLSKLELKQLGSKARISNYDLEDLEDILKDLSVKDIKKLITAYKQYYYEELNKNKDTKYIKNIVNFILDYYMCRAKNSKSDETGSKTHKNGSNFNEKGLGYVFG